MNLTSAQERLHRLDARLEALNEQREASPLYSPIRRLLDRELEQLADKCASLQEAL